MDENNHEKKHLTFFQWVRAAVATTLRPPQLSCVQGQPNIVPGSKSRVFTPSTSCTSMLASAGKEEPKKNTKESYLNVGRHGKSIQNSESGSEENTSTRSRPVTTGNIIVLHLSNRSEAAESDDSSSASSTASRQSIKPPSKTTRKKLGGNKPTGSHSPVQENTTAMSSHSRQTSHNHGTIKTSPNSEIPSATLHFYISKAYECADLPLEISVSGVPIQEESTPRATANTNQPPGPTHWPRSTVTSRSPTKEVVKSTPPKCQTVAPLNTVHMQARASPQQQTRLQTAQVTSKSPRTNKSTHSTISESRNMFHKISSNNASRHEQVRPQTAQFPRIDKPAQLASKTSLDTAMTHKAMQSNSSARLNTSRQEPADNLKSHETSTQYQPSNKKANLNKNRRVTTTTIQKYGSDGHRSAITSKVQSQSWPNNWQENRNSKGQVTSSQIKLSNTIVPIDPGGHARTNPSHKNDSEVCPRTSLASSNSRLKLLSESKYNQACSLTEMTSSDRPKTTLEKVRLPNEPSTSRDTYNNKRLSTNSPNIAAHNVDMLRRTDDTEILYSKAMTSSSCLLTGSCHTLSELLQMCQLADSSPASCNTATSEAAGHPASSPTIRQTTSFPCTKVENTLALEATDKSWITPKPLIRENTFLILKSGQRRSPCPLRRKNTFLILESGQGRLQCPLRRENSFLIHKSGQGRSQCPLRRENTFLIQKSGQGRSQCPLRRENTFLIEPSRKCSRPPVEPNKKTNMTTSSMPHVMAKETAAESGSELREKTSSEIPLLKGSTYLILAASAPTSRDSLDNMNSIPLSKKSTYIVLNPSSRTSISTNSGKMTVKRSGTYDIIEKTNSLPNINVNNM